MSERDDKLDEWLRQNTPDCGDNSCLFGGRGKGGMRTNGGCRCFKDLPTAKRIYVERLYAAQSASVSIMDEQELTLLIDYHDNQDSAAEAAGYDDAALYHARRSQHYGVMRDAIRKRDADTLATMIRADRTDQQ